MGQLAEQFGLPSINATNAQSALGLLENTETQPSPKIDIRATIPKIRLSRYEKGVVEFIGKIKTNYNRTAKYETGLSNHIAKNSTGFSEFIMKALQKGGPLSNADLVVIGTRPDENSVKLRQELASSLPFFRKAGFSIILMPLSASFDDNLSQLFKDRANLPESESGLERIKREIKLDSDQIGSDRIILSALKNGIQISATDSVYQLPTTKYQFRNLADILSSFFVKNKELRTEAYEARKEDSLHQQILPFVLANQGKVLVICDNYNSYKWSEDQYTPTKSTLDFNPRYYNPATQRLRTELMKTGKKVVTFRSLYPDMKLFGITGLDDRSLSNPPIGPTGDSILSSYTGRIPKKAFNDKIDKPIVFPDVKGSLVGRNLNADYVIAVPTGRVALYDRK
jgi:hypothetical protein